MASLPVLISIVLLNCYCGEGKGTTAVTQLPDNSDLRNRLLTATRILSNTLHKRFHKNQQIALYAETDKDANFVFNPLEISSIGAMLMSGMSNIDDYEELSEFLGYRSVYFNYEEMFQAMRQYLYNELYKVSWRMGRKVYLSTDIFTNEDFQLIESFKSNAKTLFRTEIHDLSKVGEETKKQDIQDFVKNKTFDFIGPLERLEKDFKTMMASTTYVEDFWMYPTETVANPLVLTCTIENEQFKLETSTKIITSWYLDKSDRFGIIIPFKRGHRSVFFYVPKTDDLFKDLDESMNYDYMQQLLDETLAKDLVQLKVTFPLINMSYSRDLAYDMQVKGVEKIFLPDSVKYENMTKDKNLFVSEIHHDSMIRMTENGVHFASITDLTMKKGNNSIQNENAKILQDLARKSPHNKTSGVLQVEEPDFLLKRLNIPQYRKKMIGRKEKSSKRAGLKIEKNPRSQISDILKGKLSTTGKKRKLKLKPKRRKSKKCRKTKKRRTHRNSKSYKAIPAPPDFEPTNKLPLNSKAVYHDLLGEPQATTESFQSCLNNESSSCTNSKIGNYTPLTPESTELYEMNSSQKSEMNLKRIPTVETLLGYESKSNHRQHKAFWPTDTKWGFKRPDFTWTGPRNTTINYIFTTPSISSLAIRHSFFFAIVNHNTGTFFALGKVSHCKGPDIYTTTTEHSEY